MTSRPANGPAPETTFPADVPATALAALDEATRAIAGVLDVEDALQLIVDRVRTLIGAQYAALGIVTPDGLIERFITSGITAEQRTAIGPPPTGHGLLGLLIREGHSLRIPRMSDHPASVEFPANHPPMTSFLGVPVTAHGRPVGNFYLTDKEGGAPFTAGDERLAEMFALHAGIAIDNARLHAQVRSMAVVQERDRIGRDLHDGIIQSLYAVSLSLEDLPTMPPIEAEARVDDAIDALHLAIRDIRHFIHGLSGEATDGRDLAGGLLALANELRHNNLIEVDTDLDRDADPELPEEAAAELLQLVREALSNAARHSKAAHISVTLVAAGPTSRIEVADDGVGFDLGRQREAGHRGLANMQARADTAGADLVIESRRGGGTRIIVSVSRGPRPAEAPP